MDNVTLAFGRLQYFVDALITTVVALFILLMLVRLAFNYADLNPFSRPVLLVRGWTDPFVNPVRRWLLGFGFSPNVAPLVAILIAILFGWLIIQFADSLVETAYGVVVYARLGRPVGVLGALLYGALGIYGLLLFARIIFSWGRVEYANRLTRFCVRATEPVLGPLRRSIPPFRRIDVSPLVAFLVIWLAQAAIKATLLRF
jgi:YggT family protein